MRLNLGMLSYRKWGVMALNQHLSLRSVYPLICAHILLLDPRTFSVMTRGVHPLATLPVASSKLPNPQGWSESLPVCTRCSPRPSPFFSLLIASQTQTIPPQGLAKYLLLIQEINPHSKVMDHNVLMCCLLRCFLFNKGRQCLNRKVGAVVHVLLALSSV